MTTTNRKQDDEQQKPTANARDYIHSSVILWICSISVWGGSEGSSRIQPPQETKSIIKGKA